MHKHTINTEIALTHLFRATELSPSLRPPSTVPATMATNNTHNSATFQPMLDTNTNSTQMKLKLGSSALIVHLLKSLVVLILPSHTLSPNYNKPAASTLTNNDIVKYVDNCLTYAHTSPPSYHHHHPAHAHCTHTPNARTSLLSIDSFYTTTTASFASFAFVSASSSSSSSTAFIIPPLSSSSSTTSAGNLLSFNVNAHHLDDSRVYRRLLVQLEETERRFDDFWSTHLTRLKQCLDLRRFEQDFRELQVSRPPFFFLILAPIEILSFRFRN